MPLSFDVLRQQNVSLLGSEENHLAYVRESNLLAERTGLIKVPDLHLVLGEVFSLAPYQTGFRDQRGRGTCYSFASCAAMEAAYKRSSGLELELSAQYNFHMNKVTELFPGYVTDARPYENNSSMIGFQGSSGIIDKMVVYAIPDATAAPYLSATQMQAIKDSIPAAGTLSTQPELDAFEFDERHIPTSARLVARYRVQSFAALPANPSVDDVKKVLKAGYEVVADIPDHCFLIVGFDDNRSVFQVKNSWAEGAFIDYEYSKPVLGGRYITAVAPVSDPQKRSWWLGRWQLDHDGWVGELVIRRFYDFHVGDNVPTKLGDYLRDGNRYDVNGTVSPDGQTMDFWIAGTTARTEPGSAAGQHFQLHVFSFDPSHAAGWTEWEGTRYGARMSRAASAHTLIDSFDSSRWVDTWATNHDGWKSRLLVSQVNPLVARYEAGDHTIDVTGEVDPAHPHILNIAVPFNELQPQKFQLLHHTWEDGAFSGTTSWEGRAFGVIGDRFVEPYYPPFAPPGEGVMATFLYAVQPDGILQWYRHDGARHGTRDWKGARAVGRGWGGLKAVIPGGGDIIYAIDAGGKLLWFEHKGFNTGAGLQDAGSWAGAREIGHGWGGFRTVFSGGNGIIYAITTEGRLMWYRHHGVASGAGLETPGSWSGPKEVAFGWDQMVHVFSTGGGIIYGVAADGTLYWYNHLGHLDGLGLDNPAAWAAPKPVGTGWASVKQVFAAGDGVIYAIQPDGTLRWFRHLAYQTGGGLNDPGSWEGGIDVGTGWQNFTTVLALLPRDPEPIR